MRRERNAVPTAGLGGAAITIAGVRGDGPCRLIEVELVPLGSEYIPHPSSREDEGFERAGWEALGLGQ